MDPLMMIRLAAILLGSGAAAYTDAKTGLIDDKITYSMIVVGVLLNVVAFATSFDAFIFIIPAAVFAIGFVLYWLGKIGGGDVKLFTGISLLMPLFNGKIYILHVLVVAAVLSIVFYSVYYVGKYWRKGISLKENKQSIFSSALLAVILGIYFYYLSSMQGIEPVVGVVFYATALFALLFMAFEKGIKKNFFLKEVTLGKLEEDEVIATEFLEEDIKKKLKLYWKGIFGNKEIEELKKMGVKKVPVYRQMPPFAPFIFFGVLVLLWAPEIFGFLVI